MKHQNLAGLAVMLCVGLTCFPALAEKICVERSSRVIDMDKDTPGDIHRFCEVYGECFYQNQYTDVTKRCTEIPETKSERERRLIQNEINYRQYLRDEKYLETIEKNRTPEELEELRKQCVVPPGPYYEYRGKEKEKLFKKFEDKLAISFEGNDLMKPSGHISINDNGQWFVCYSAWLNLKNGYQQRHDWIMSSEGWMIDNFQVGRSFFNEIEKKACYSNGEIAE
ncbi:hypothetical protein [Granulibacter bethesdensis]|nr:hypothetical protein [Granulibacter bethesdensis]